MLKFRWKTARAELLHLSLTHTSCHPLFFFLLQTVLGAINGTDVHASIPRRPSGEPTIVALRFINLPLEPDAIISSAYLLVGGGENKEYTTVTFSRLNLLLPGPQRAGG